MKTRATTLIPFIPSGPDFDTALAFFGDLGFEAAWRNGDIASLRFGDATFLLQKIHVPAWQENQMHVVEVDDLDTYWEEINALDLPTKYSGVLTKEPTDFAWGREVNINDPAGLCWHVRKAR